MSTQLVATKLGHNIGASQKASAHGGECDWLLTINYSTGRDDGSCNHQQLWTVGIFKLPSVGWLASVGSRAPERKQVDTQIINLIAFGQKRQQQQSASTLAKW